jgi:hypothetical protein
MGNSKELLESRIAPENTTQTEKPQSSTAINQPIKVVDGAQGAKSTFFAPSAFAPSA